MTPSPLLAGYILTKDEEIHIERAVTSMKSVCEHILVFDSNSVDNTVSIAERLGCVVKTSPFENYSSQRSKAIKALIELFNPQYIIALDADEYLDNDLINSINRLKTGNTLTDFDAYLINRRTVFDGKVLRWGGFQRTWLIRLVASHLCAIDEKPVNETVQLDSSCRLLKLDGHIVNENLKGWEDYIDKHNKYSSLEAQVLANQKPQIKISLTKAIKIRSYRRRWIRENIWPVIPAKPIIRFVQIYLLSLGFLDGKAGLRRAVFEAWQEMCTEMKAERLMKSAQ